jgi:ribonuclease HIII
MASKHIREKKAFERAKQVRDILITQLTKCHCTSDLEKIQKNYNANQTKGKFAVAILTPYHAAIIQSLNFQITQLFIAKIEQFAPVEVHGPVDTHTDNGNLDVVVDRSSPVASFDQEDNKPTDVSDKTLVELGPVTEPGTVNPIDTQVVDPVITNNAVVQCQGENHDDYVNIAPSKEKYLVAVRNQIKNLEDKTNIFYSTYWFAAKEGDFKKYTKYLEAYNAASVLLDEVQTLINQYSTGKINLPTFKSKAKELFDEKNANIKQLQTHRGWKETLVNVLAAIIGNVFFLTAAACIGTLTLFKLPTDTANKVKRLAEAVKNVEEDEEEENLDLANLCKC